VSRIAVIAPVSSSTGFGCDALARMKSLVEQGYEIIVRPSLKAGDLPNWLRVRLSGPEIPKEKNELLIGPPAILPTPGRRSVYYSTLESTQPTAHSLKMLERAAAVIVPCAWNRESLSHVGFTKPVRICPQGVDETIFKPRANNKGSVFLIGAAGNSANSGVGRKGLEDVITAFTLAFPRDPRVVLVVKEHPGSPLVCFDRRVELVKEQWTQQRLAEWYASLDVFVSMSHGEAWGRMVHEAMACGVPVITPNHGGVAEYFQPDCGWDLPWTDTPASDGWAGSWCQADFDSLVECMREVRANPDVCQERGRNARKRAMDFTWHKVNPQFIHALLDFGVIEQHQSNLI
jgi:glycosyltransferase involved in cell wall biosynthesis